jgi:hypothetical protein
VEIHLRRGRNGAVELPGTARWHKELQLGAAKRVGADRQPGGEVGGRLQHKCPANFALDRELELTVSAGRSGQQTYGLFGRRRSRDQTDVIHIKCGGVEIAIIPNPETSKVILVGRAQCLE